MIGRSWRSGGQPQTTNDIKIRRLVAEVRRLRADCYLDDEELRALSRPARHLVDDAKKRGMFAPRRLRRPC